MDHRTVLALLVTALQVSAIVGQAPSLGQEDQCSALVDRKLFHVCSAGASLRSARAASSADPFADAVMHNAQHLLDKASTLIGHPPSKPTPIQTAAKHDAVLPSLLPIDRLRQTAQAMAVSSCVLRNAAGTLEDAAALLENAIRAMEGGGVWPQHDASGPAAPFADVVAGLPIAGHPHVSVGVNVNGQPVHVNPVIEISQQSNSGPPNARPPSPSNPNPSNPHPHSPHPSNPDHHDPDHHHQALCEEDIAGHERLNMLNTQVQSLYAEVAVMLQRLGSALTTPHRSQAYVRLVRAPLEEIQQIQLVLARSEGAELEDEVEAAAIVQDLQRQLLQFKRLLDVPDELAQKLKQPKDSNSGQGLVSELRALRLTVTKVLPFPQDMY